MVAPATTADGLVVKASWVGEPAAPAGLPPLAPSVARVVPTTRISATASSPNGRRRDP